MITIDKLQKKFGDRVVLSDISVTFEKGKVVSLIGPSGGGKSTLLRCVNGLETFDAGSITVDDLKLEPGDAKKN